MQTIIIGDTHGCRAEVEDLLDRCAYADGDTVIFTGDFLDRGPEPRQLVDLARKLQARQTLPVSIKGNHEDYHTRKYNQAPMRSMEKPDHNRTRMELLADGDGPARMAFLTNLPLFVRLPDRDVAVVHAGVIPDVPLERMHSNLLLHAQAVRPPELRRPNKHGYWPDTYADTWWLSKAPADAKFWTEYYTGPTRVVFGHTYFERPLVLPHAVGLDTGCVFGHALSAISFPSERVVSIPARGTYVSERANRRVFDVSGVKCCA